MFKLAIEVCFKIHLGLTRTMFLSPGSTKSVYFFGTPSMRTKVEKVSYQKSPTMNKSLLDDNFER